MKLKGLIPNEIPYKEYISDFSHFRNW